VRRSRIGRGAAVAAAIAAAAAVAAPPAGAARPAACWPKGSTTLGRSDHARVFRARDGIATYGCLYSRARAYRLGGQEVERPVRLAGRYVAYVYRFPGDEEAEGFTDLRLADLTSGRVVRSATAWTDPVHGVGSDTIVTRLLLRRTGGIAWIATDFHAPDGPRVPEVWRADQRGPRMLADSPDVDERSLRFCGSGRVCWEQGGRERRASLR
jgi:hypothetical protein